MMHKMCANDYACFKFLVKITLLFRFNHLRESFFLQTNLFLAF